MRVDYHTHPCPPLGRLMDKDTGKEIPKACFFDEETGEWERYVTDNTGNILQGPDGSPLTEKGRGRIKFFPKR